MRTEGYWLVGVTKHATPRTTVTSLATVVRERGTVDQCKVSVDHDPTTPLGFINYFV